MTEIKNEYDFYKLKKWVELNRLHWWKLVLQKNAVPFIEKHFDILNKDVFTRHHYEQLSKNPFAVELLRKNPDKIVWMEFVCNPNGMHVIEENLDVCFQSLNAHGIIQLLSHPNFIHIIPKHTDKIIDKLICRNCLPIIARKESMVYMDLLDKYMLKYPDKIHDFQNGSYFWDDLVKNPCAIHIIERYLDKLSLSSWQSLASNPNAIPFIEDNLHKFTQQGWRNLCENPNAIPLLKQHIDKIDWFTLCNNRNAHLILEEQPGKIKCYSFIDYENFSTDLPIFEYDYDVIQERCNIYKEELMQIALHPSRIESYLQQGIRVEDLGNYI
jgi:hypothetical protein